MNLSNLIPEILGILQQENGIPYHFSVKDVHIICMYVSYHALIPSEIR